MMVFSTFPTPVDLLDKGCPPARGNEAITASEAFERYKSAFEADALIQSKWHNVRQGRNLSCVLGVLGDDIDSVRKCPAQIMPLWLAQMVTWFFDGMDFIDAKAWGLAFYEQIKRLDGSVPFSVVYDWHATAVGPFAVEAAKKLKRDAAPHEALMAMHARAAKGEKFSAHEWFPVLNAAFADANANAPCNAKSPNYARVTAHNAAITLTPTYAEAADPYATAYVFAYAEALVDAKRAAIKYIADGMVEALSRAREGPHDTA